MYLYMCSCIYYLWLTFKGDIYRTSSIRHCGYIYILLFSLFILVWLLIKGDILFHWEAGGWQRWLNKVHVGDTDAGGSTCSLSVLLSAVEMSIRTRTALEIAQWVLAEIISTCVRAPRILAVGYHSKVATISLRPSDCVATIRGWWLFNGGI